MGGLRPLSIFTAAARGAGVRCATGSGDSLLHVDVGLHRAMKLAVVGRGLIEADPFWTALNRAAISRYGDITS